MKKIMGLGTMLLAGLLVIPGYLRLANQIIAQSNAQTEEDKDLQELRQKRQEQWQERERQVKPGERQQDAVKRQQDAGQRQKDAERRLQELEEEEN